MKNKIISPISQRKLWDSEKWNMYESPRSGGLIGSASGKDLILLCPR
jgi:hypothetical protein